MRTEHRTQPQRLGASGLQLPRDPADQAVNGIALLGFGERELQVGAVEAVAAFTDTVGPGDEQLPSPAGDGGIGCEAVQQGPPVHFVVAQGRAQLDHDGLLPPPPQGPLIACRAGGIHGGRGRGARGAPMGLPAICRGVVKQKRGQRGHDRLRRLIDLHHHWILVRFRFLQSGNLTVQQAHREEVASPVRQPGANQLR